MAASFLDAAMVTGKFERCQNSDDRDRVFWADEDNFHLGLHLRHQLGNNAGNIA